MGVLRSIGPAALAAALAVFTYTTEVRADEPAASESAPASTPAAAEPLSPQGPTVPAAPSTEEEAKAAHLPITKVAFAYRDDNVVRSGPGTDYAILGIFPKGSTFVVIAKSGDWYDVRLSDTKTGWVHRDLCREFEDLSHLEFRPNPHLFSRMGSFVATGYTGGYAFDRKSNSLVAGARLGYYLLEFLQVEGALSWTHISRDQEIVESLFDLRLEAEKFHVLFYEMNLGLDLLPGRQIVPYLAGGVGSSILRGSAEPTINLGGGTSVCLSKSVALRWEVRGYRFHSGEGRARRDNTNIAFTMGTSLLF